MVLTGFGKYKLAKSNTDHTLTKLNGTWNQYIDRSSNEKDLETYESEGENDNNEVNNDNSEANNYQ